MLMEAEGRNDRQEDLLLHDISIAEFECEMHKKKTPNQNNNLSNIPNV